MKNNYKLKTLLGSELMCIMMMFSGSISAQTVQGTGIEVMKAERSRHPLGNGALAGSGRAVDGNDWKLTIWHHRASRRSG